MIKIYILESFFLWLNYRYLGLRLLFQTRKLEQDCATMESDGARGQASDVIVVGQPDGISYVLLLKQILKKQS